MKRILIVDDERNVRLTYRVALETDGHRSAEAASAAEALTALQRAPFDLILLDLRMPGTDGLELLRLMRGRGIATPVVIVTAYGSLPDAAQAMRLGAIDFLQKPLRPADLRRSVAESGVASSASAVAQGSELDLDRVRSLIHASDLRAAQAAVLRALEADERSPDAFNLAGVIAEMKGDLRQARKLYGRAIWLDTNHDAAQGNMRRLFELNHLGSSNEPYHLGER